MLTTFKSMLLTAAISREEAAVNTCLVRHAELLYKAQMLTEKCLSRKQNRRTWKINWGGNGKGKAQGGNSWLSEKILHNRVESW